MLTKEKNNMHKQCTLPNDEHPFKGSNRHKTDINGCQKWHLFLIRRLMLMAISNHKGPHPLNHKGMLLQKTQILLRFEELYFPYFLHWK